MNKLFIKTFSNFIWPVLLISVISSAFFLLIAAASFACRNPQPLQEINVSYERNINRYLNDYTEAALKANYAQAEQVMKRAILEYPGFAPFYYNLFMALDRQGKTIEAKGYLQKFLQMMPFAIDSDPEIQYNAKRYGLI
jgi:tetratricopeptide (TPR) repeat protein